MQRQRIGERMADEAGIDAVLRVNRWFHREQTEHAVCAAPDLRGTTCAPGPDRGADVVHGANAALLQSALQAEVEVRRIDADEHVGLPRQQPRSHGAPQPQQSRQVPEHLGQAHHGQFRAVVPGRKPGGAHLRSADAGELGSGEAFAQLRDQAGAEQVARRLAGDQRDALGRGHRTSERSLRSMKSSISCTSGAPCAASASWVRASASGRPDLYRVR